MTIRMILLDPRAQVRTVPGLGIRREIVRGLRRRPCRCLIIAKARGGTARTREEVVHG